MKNLFVFIAVFFGGFVLSFSLGLIFALYGFKTAEIILFSCGVAFFVGFAVVVCFGYINAVKRKKRVEYKVKENKIDKK